MTASGLELLVIRCPVCQAEICVEAISDMRRLDWRTVAMTCPICDEWFHEFWPGHPDDPPAFARVDPRRKATE